MSFPQYVRVTDEVKPRREYSVVESAVDPEFHTVLDKPGANPDGTPAAVKYTPDELTTSDGYAGWKVPDLRAELDRRNSERDEPIAVEEPGNKPELIAALEGDDALD